MQSISTNIWEFGEGYFIKLDFWVYLGLFGSMMFQPYQMFIVVNQLSQDLVYIIVVYYHHIHLKQHYFARLIHIFQNKSQFTLLILLFLDLGSIYFMDSWVTHTVLD